MAQLEDRKPSRSIEGILPNASITVVNFQWNGSEALELTYKEPSGRVFNELTYRHDEPRLEIVQQGRPWSFDGSGVQFHLASEAHRIWLAHLFDPVVAVHNSDLEPSPHQIIAMHEAMRPRPPLQFPWADDPGTGKTLIVGMFIHELLTCGNFQFCLVVHSESLVDQWQDELYRKFHSIFSVSYTSPPETKIDFNY